MAATTKIAKKYCVSCGRPIEPRRRWRDQWSQVRFCSRYCRNRGVNATDMRLERAILELLSSRAAEGTICPSEAARALATGGDWRGLMEPARRAARRLSHSGRVQILQKGKIVDPGNFRGPVCIRKASESSRAIR